MLERGGAGFREVIIIIIGLFNTLFVSQRLNCTVLTKLYIQIHLNTDLTINNQKEL